MLPQTAVLNKEGNSQFLSPGISPRQLLLYNPFLWLSGELVCLLQFKVRLQTDPEMCSGKRLNWIKAVTVGHRHLDDKALPTSQLPFLSTGQPVMETCLFTQVWPRAPHVKCEGHLETFSKASGFSSHEGWHSVISKSTRECPLATESPPNLMPCHFTEPNDFFFSSVGRDGIKLTGMSCYGFHIVNDLLYDRKLLLCTKRWVKYEKDPKTRRIFSIHSEIREWLWERITCPHMTFP